MINNDLAVIRQHKCLLCKTHNSPISSWAFGGSKGRTNSQNHSFSSLLSWKAVISPLSLLDLRVVTTVITACTAGMMAGSSLTVVAADSTEGYFNLTKAQCDAVSSSPESTGQIQHQLPKTFCKCPILLCPSSGIGSGNTHKDQILSISTLVLLKLQKYQAYWAWRCCRGLLVYHYILWMWSCEKM